MVQLDRLKFVSPLDGSVNDFNPEWFKCEQNHFGEEENWILNSRYFDEIPFKLFIRLNFPRNELTIESSSKILRDNYPAGITGSTFQYVLTELSYYVRLDNEFILNNSEVVSCDIKKDIPIELDQRSIRTIPLLLKPSSKFDCNKFSNGVSIKKRNSTINRNFNLKFYNKGKEIRMSKNDSFVNFVDHPYSIYQAFSGITRVELELKSKHLIRTFFNTQNLSIDSILNSPVDPMAKGIHSFFEPEPLPVTSTFECNSIGEYKNYLLVEKCDFDIEKVEKLLREKMSWKTNLRSAIKPYKKIILAGYSIESLVDDKITQLVNKLKYEHVL